MTGLVELRDAHDAARFGNKAAGLARVIERVPVPAALVVSGQWLTDQVTPHLGRDWPGCSPTELAGARLTTAAATRLNDAVSAHLPGLHTVVRSSSVAEDTAAASFAGVFTSVLDVSIGELPDAIMQVWRSAFSPAAREQYRRLGRDAAPGSMNVLVQQAITPELAGVAFTEPGGGAYIEWVTGHGADLVDGRRTAIAERLSAVATEPGWRSQLALALQALPPTPTGHDVEWVWDGDTLWIVQVRPQTRRLTTAARRQAAGLQAVPLYEGDLLGLQLGECAEMYGRIRAKRRVPRALALTRGAAVPGGWLANWDPATDPVELTRWGQELPDRLVIDAGPGQRQHIVDRAEFANTVTRLAELDPPPPGRSFAFLCREFLDGELALLSTVAADGTVFVEASTDGLLAVNRGFGSAHPLSIAQLSAAVGPELADAVVETTCDLSRRLHPRATAEWVLQGNRLYFVDYSAPGPGLDRLLTDTRVLSPGRTGGRVQQLRIDQALTDSSIAPMISIAQPVTAGHEQLLVSQLHERLSLAGGGIVIAAARPIAVLAMLIGVVDGFVFEEGALLCHLGIMLREAGVPAAIVGTGNLPADGARIELVHGTVLTRE